MNQFKTEAAPDNRGKFERTLADWYRESMATHDSEGDTVGNDPTLRQLQAVSGCSDAERIIIGEAVRQAVEAVAAALGRSIDDVTVNNGIRYFAIPFIITGIGRNLAAIHTVLERVLEEQMIFGKGDVGCDCGVCNFTELLNEAHEHLPPRLNRLRR